MTFPVRATLVLVAGMTLTIVGYFGPPDGGDLEFVGVVIVGFAARALLSRDGRA